MIKGNDEFMVKDLFLFYFLLSLLLLFGLGEQNDDLGA